MIEEIEQIIKEEARGTFKKFLIISVICLVMLILFLLQFALMTPGHTNYIVVPVVILAPLFMIPVTVKSFFLMKNPNAKKTFKKFCNATASPKTTLAQLKDTWKHGLMPEVDESASISPEIKDMVSDFFKAKSFQGFEFPQEKNTRKIPNIRFSREFIIIAVGLKIKIVPLENAVWVYKFKDNFLYIHFADGGSYKRKGYYFQNIQNISTTDFIADCISLNCPDIAVGSCKETKELWKGKNKDISGLRAYARRYYKGV
ncbi:MAG: hypothetical protein FWD48_05665 [Oscillospiraceae bacterium]|nr:hypothetical protein [Oscillospiraceae bacterium]